LLQFVSSKKIQALIGLANILSTKAAT